MTPFVPLHVHTTYSLLDGMCKIVPLVKRVRELGMGACAITDHGVLFGLKAFYDACRSTDAKKFGDLPPIKPILGCEAYVARHSRFDRVRDNGDLSGNHLILLAKNRIGYHNLVRLMSLAQTEGFYGKPRVDKELLEKYHEGLIASSACLAGSVAENIVDGNLDKAEESARWYQSIFGDDYYLEVMLHKAEGVFFTPGPNGNQELYNRQSIVNQAIFELADKLGIPVVATNDTHFLMKEDAEAHDILLCMSQQTTEKDPKRMRYTRQEWLKSGDEMAAIFPDHPEALANTVALADKIENYDLDSKPIMPVFPIPEDFGTDEEYEKRYPTPESIQDKFEPSSFERFKGNTPEGLKALRRILFEGDYLRKITYDGVARRWPGDKFTEEERERVDFELKTILNMGFPGYFLIVSDYVSAARRLGVLVGPGRGSAAGSAVAYCLGITDIDPIKYDLLFERFLNPDRISMPDIDEDFDDAGRAAVMEYVVQKYGADHVSHIVTFGSMAPKTCIRDIGRALEYPLADTLALAKLVPDGAGVKSFKDAYAGSADLLNKKKYGNPIEQRILNLSERIDGCLRQPGVHACGIIISRDPLIDSLPIMPTDGENLMTTQYDGHFVEPIGLLKMDFLGLSTLTVFKECLATIKEVRREEVDLSNIPIDDNETYKIFQRGDTTGLFQFESDGMKKHLRALRPTCLADLVAMNALYRPGPMQYIPQFIERKHDPTKIAYDHPLMEKYLKETYGVTVYQEQVMLLSRELGGFTRGQSDTLRKAMGKKQLETMEKLKAKFQDGCLANPRFMEPPPINGDRDAAIKLIDKIWADWVEFAKYAFNKSHAVCYAFVAYQTGYLKAHYPAEYMCAQISSEIGNFDKMPVFVTEASEMGYEILAPNVNHSSVRFVPEVVRSDEDTETTAIRFGLAGIKGVGTGAAESIVEARRKDGPFKSLDDFLLRVDALVNKKTLESLAYSGALEDFGYHRAALIDEIPRALARVAGDKADRAAGQGSLFDLMGDDSSMAGGVPSQHEIDDVNDHVVPLAAMEQALKEKELLGIYISGHPLTRYQNIISRFKSFSSIVNDMMPALESRLGPFRRMYPDGAPRRPDPGTFAGGESSREYAAAESKYAIDSKEFRLSRMRMSTKVRFCAFVNATQLRQDKQGRNWLKITLEDTAAKLEIPIFARDYEHLINPLPANPEAMRDPPEVNCAYLFEGSVEPSFRLETQLSISNFYPIEDVPKKFAKSVSFTLSGRKLQEDVFLGLKDLIERYPGNVKTSLQLRMPDRTRVLFDMPPECKVEPSREFISEAEKLVGEKFINYVMNDD